MTVDSCTLFRVYSFCHPETITYSLVDRDLLKKSGINTAAGLIEILNPLSKEQEVLRPALFPSLIRALAHNLDFQTCKTKYRLAE